MIDWTDINKAQFGLSFILGLVVFFLLLILYVWHRDSKNSIDIKDLICVDGRLDEKKFVRFGAWIVSTWGFVYLIIDDSFSEWYFAGYMAAWVGNALIDKYLTRNNAKVDNNGPKVEERRPYVKKPEELEAWRKYENS